MRLVGALIVSTALLFSISGCAGMSTMEQRVLSGGAIGAATGVGIAAVAGGPLIVGGAAGAAAGAVGGYVLDEVARR
ncbi:MAG: hypothetical protein AB2L11_00370 [Syntrophobacteraceae bacterium]